MANEKKLVEQITSMDEDFVQWYTDIVKKAEVGGRGLRKTNPWCNSLAHRTTWLRSYLPYFFIVLCANCTKHLFDCTTCTKLHEQVVIFSAV